MGKFLMCKNHCSHYYECSPIIEAMKRYERVCGHPSPMEHSLHLGGDVSVPPCLNFHWHKEPA